MALITIERIVSANSLTKSDDGHLLNLKGEENFYQEDHPNISNEIYIAVREADIIFPFNECHRYSKASPTNISTFIQKHLQSIFEILQPQDTMKMAVRLESQYSSTRIRYLLVVSNETDQSCLLGIDYDVEATIGLVLPIWSDMKIMLDGDGGFRITSGISHHIFKPVSVQAMWSIFQALHLAIKKSVKNNYYKNSGSHLWVSHYQNKINSSAQCRHEWHTISTDQSEINSIDYESTNKPKEQISFEKSITTKLKQVMMTLDLEQVTSKEIRSKLELDFQRDLTEFKSFIDKEMIRIMGQMEEPSKILDYLYLGSEWNASNFEELKVKGVQKILNVTSEIDNYFPGYFDYYNIRVDDDEGTNMLPHLNDTYCYIRKARDEGVKVLVHCKKGISRSASVVVAYIMKEKSCNLSEALQYVKNHRSTIRPNPEFLKQLEIYQGMLNASNNKNINAWGSNFETNLNSSSSIFKKSDYKETRSQSKKRFSHQSSGKVIRLEDKENSHKFHRRKSWPPKNNFLFSQKENTMQQINRNNNQSDSCLYTNLANFDNCKLEIKSRVKERIEDFENKQPLTKLSKSKNIFKESILKNGLVLNLACQFESRESCSNVDFSNVHQIQRIIKPIIRSRHSSQDEPFELSNQQQKYHTISFSKMKYNEYSSTSNQVVKRTLSYDEVVDLVKSLDKKENFPVNLKRIRRYFDDSEPCPIESTSKQHHHFKKMFCRFFCSLPNLHLMSTELSLPTQKQPEGKTQFNYVMNNTCERKSEPYLKFPLDLYYIQNKFNKSQNDNAQENDGFVKKRTEELENSSGLNHHRKNSMKSASKSNSMPSSPNLSNPSHDFIANDNLTKNHSRIGASDSGHGKVKSNSFNCSQHRRISSNTVSCWPSITAVQLVSNKNTALPPLKSSMVETSSKKIGIVTSSKKTYGKSHPLGILKKVSPGMTATKNLSSSQFS